ncbi:MAG: hypothetical protein ACTSRW_01620 [Candidatus Helarchaeota archaeon]
MASNRPKRASNCTKEVLTLLETAPQTSKSLENQSRYKGRTIRLVLKKLLDAKVVRRIPNFEDLRQYYYILN